MPTACIHALAASCAAVIGGASEEPTKMNSLYPMGRKRGGAGSAHDCREFCRSRAIRRQKEQWEASRSTANATKMAQRKGPRRIWHHDPFEKSGPWRSDRSALALSQQLTADRESRADREPSSAQFCDFGKAERPAYSASSPRRSSMRSSWLYLATRSPRAGAPDLICMAFMPTERSAMVSSGVSPER